MTAGTPGARRARRHRDRRRRNVKAIVTVEVSEPLVRRLVRDGRLPYADGDGQVRVTRAAISEAIGDMLNVYANES